VLVFISNDLSRSAEVIADLYKQRWQIELFFKWIKQNLKIKIFLGRSENAVMIQVLVAMIAYLLLKLIQLGIRCDFSLQKIARILSLNLTTRRAIEDLLHPDPGRNENNNEHSPQLELEVSYV
jgi:putative transposase